MAGGGAPRQTIDSPFGYLGSGTTAVVQPRWARSLYADVPMWLLRRVTPRLMARLAGVPPDYTRTPADDRFLSEFPHSLFPIAPRAEGIAFEDTGGHLGLGQTGRVRTAIDAFIGPPSTTRPLQQVPS